MWPRPTPPPVVRKPTLPLPYTFYNEGPFEDTVQRVLAIAATGDGLRSINYTSSESLLLAAIDPATGDSTLHRAAAAGNIAFMRDISNGFGRQISQRPGQERLYWVLMVHQNLAGDTALHAAARAGNLRGAKGVYRLFHFDDLDVDDETRGPDSEEPPAEDWDWGRLENDPYATDPSLAFVCTKNLAGRDAAAEARAAGHNDLAAWLDRLAERLDRAGMRTNEDYMRRARRIALKNYWYYDDDDYDKEEEKPKVEGG